MATKGSDKKGQAPPPPDTRSIADVLKQLSNQKELKTGSLREEFENLRTSVQKQNTKEMSKTAATFIAHYVSPHGRSRLTPEQLQELMRIADKKYFPEGFEKEILKETATVDAGSAEKPPVQDGNKPAPNISTSSNTDSDQLPQPQSSDAKSHGKGNTNMTPTKSDGSPVTRQKLKENERSGAHAEEKSSSAINDDKNLLKKREAELKELEKENLHLADKVKSQGEKLTKAEGNLKSALAERDSSKKDLKDRLELLGNQEKNIEDLNSENASLLAKLREITEEKEKALNKMHKDCQIALEKAFKDNNNRMTDMKDKHESDLRALKGQLADVFKEREDLKTRFSKLAGSKLTDQNADIADLSDPNRAMKISEKFSQLYDDEWTDAFEALKGKKVQARDAIQLLLGILQDCQTFCNSIKETQMISLSNVLLHPSQDVTKFASEPRKNISV